MSDDIRGGTPASWLAIGWFTPDYRQMAEAFAVNLSEHAVPFHLWAMAKSPKGWDTTSKPSVVLTAMGAYPGKALVLMDVDCVVNGDLAPVTKFPEDVGVTAFAGVPTLDWRIWLGLSSRVVVFRPTDAARSFAKAWEDQVKVHGKHDERCMAMAFLSCPGVRFSYLDRAYSGREIAQFPGSVIGHDGTRSEHRRGDGRGITKMIKAIERSLKTGRSRERKLQAKMAAVVRAI